MQKISAKKWLIGYAVLTLSIMGIIVGSVIFIDPFFHYHRPYTEWFYYQLTNSRSQNDGISKHFDFDAIITGSSMAQNFKTSDMERIFGVNAVKMTYGGASYKEINDNLNVAIKNHPNEIKMVVRSLDMTMFFQNKDAMRFDLGTYPTYLYDDNPINDYKYILNKDIILNYCYPMLKGMIKGEEPGITSFDIYDSWMPSYEGMFGKEYVLDQHSSFTLPESNAELTESNKATIRSNLEQNVLDICRDNPNVEFYVFITPYSAVYWGDLNSQGLMYRQLDAEKYVIEYLLGCENLHLYSFNTEFDITTNLDNYKDANHYGEWINTWILECMKEGKGEITEDNYLEYVNLERDYYSKYDFNTLFE